MVTHATFNSSIGFQLAAQCQYACIITYLLSFTFTYLLMMILQAWHGVRGQVGQRQIFRASFRRRLHPELLRFANRMDKYL